MIRAVVRAAKLDNASVIGFRRGWRGIIQNEFMELDLNTVADILPRGGTILGTSRTNPYKKEGDAQKVRDTIKKNHLDGVVAIGGEDTLGAAYAAAYATAALVGASLVLRRRELAP